MKRFLTAFLLLASPAFAQIADQTKVLEQVKAENPAAWSCAHTDRPCAWDYIKLVACRLNPTGFGAWGLNGRRGDPAPAKMSWDALNYCGQGPASDPTKACGSPLTIIDVIASAGATNASITWNPFTNDPTPGAWIRPRDCAAGPVPPVQPPILTPVYPPYPSDESILDRIGISLFVDFAEAGQQPNQQMFRFAFRVAYSWLTKEVATLEESFAKHRREWRVLLGLPALP